VLSILVLCALPPWPADKTTLETWVDKQAAALKKDGHVPVCAVQRKLIDTFVSKAKHVGKGHADLHKSMRSLLDDVDADHVSLEMLASCSCTSKGMVNNDKANRAAHSASRWYWETGARIAHRGEKDSEAITKGRAAILDTVFSSELASVSLLGTVTLGPEYPQPTVLMALWRGYLTELCNGNLQEFLERIDEIATSAEGMQNTNACRVALIDTFFFVVTLDLVNLAGASAESARDALVSSAVDMNRSGGGNVALSAVGVAAAGALAGVAGLGPKLSTRAGLAAATLGYAKHFGKAISAPAKWSERETAPQVSLKETGKEALKSFAKAAVLGKKGVVKNAAMLLCGRALKQTTLADSKQLETTAARIQTMQERVKLGKRPQVDRTLMPPLFFPLAPPGGTIVTTACVGGSC
jgi:hypothetical protein